MENNIPGQRTTLCINEAFHFLESEEYSITESTCSRDNSFHKRTISDSNIKGNNSLKQNSIKVNKIQELDKDENKESTDFDFNQITPDTKPVINKKQMCKRESNQSEKISKRDTKEFYNEKNTENIPAGNTVVSEQSNFNLDKGFNQNVQDFKCNGGDDQGFKCNEEIYKETTLAKGDNQDFIHIKGKENELTKGNNLKKNSWLLKNEICDDNDSGCVEGYLVVDFATDVPSHSKDNSRQTSGHHSKNPMNNDVLLEKSNLNLENLEKDTVINGCDENFNDEFNEVVRLRPKSTTSPNSRHGTTQIVSDAFWFLKDLENLEEKNIRRSSGYKSCTIPEDVSMVTSNVDKIRQNGASKNNDSQIKAGSESRDQEVNKKLKRMRSQESQREEDNSEDSSDEDTGIYNESFRNSCWICLDNSQPVMQEPLNEADENGLDEDRNKNDDVFIESKSPPILNGNTNGPVFNHRRSDSTTTTASEKEFKRSFKARRKCFVQRNDSQQEYERMSCRVFENERKVVLEKKAGDSGFGLHILDTHPVMVSGVDHDSPAFRAGIKEGQILLMVNGVSVLEANHDRIISLVQQSKESLEVEVANTDIHFIRDMQKPVLAGYLYKQKQSTFVRSWKRRFCVLRQDNCLYYFKNEGDVDPLGAIPMMNYIVSRHQDSSKEYCFKADKFGAKTYYFSVESREEMAKWVGAMNEAALTSKKRKESWMDVTSHNVGLPALEVRKAECSGYLMKCGRTTRTWQKRYCILKDACIYYYKNINSPQAQGMAHLHGYTLNDHSKKFSFMLKPPEIHMKQFIFATDNDTDKKRWVDALTRSINRWIKVD